MPFALRDGCRLYWKCEGEPDRPSLVLLNSIGTDMALWDRTVPQLLSHFKVLRMDMRGHGASDAPEGDYSMGRLAEDVLAVMDAAGIDRAALAGVSLGGMVAMELALDSPDRVSALALICTSAQMDRDAWSDRVAKVRSGGTREIVDLAMGRFLSPAFALNHPAIEQSIRSELLNMPAAGYAGAGAAIRDMDLIDRLPTIEIPTLVIAGTRDISTPYAEHGARIVAAVPGAEIVKLACAHLAPLEEPAGVAAALQRFLLRDGPVDAAGNVLFEAGLVNRRRILGDEWVDSSLASSTPFNRDFQRLITRVAWQEVWGRTGLDERTRRLLVLAITASLGRWEEFRLHVRAGLERDGFTRDELKEVLIQTAIYAGLPAGNTGFSEAAEVIASMDE